VSKFDLTVIPDSRWLEGRKADGKAEALPQVDGAEGEGDAEPAMEVESAAQAVEGEASAPPAEAAEASEAAPAVEAAPAPAAEAPAAETAAAEATTMEVDGAAAEAPKADEAKAEDPLAEAAKDEIPAKATPKYTFPEPTHTDAEFVIPDCNSFLRKALYQASLSPRFRLFCLGSNLKSLFTCFQEIGAKHPTLHLSSRQAGSDSRQKGIVVALEAPKDDKVVSLLVEPIIPRRLMCFPGGEIVCPGVEIWIQVSFSQIQRELLYSL
jgi:hypothetical protein